MSDLVSTQRTYFPEEWQDSDDILDQRTGTIVTDPVTSDVFYLKILLGEGSYGSIYLTKKGNALSYSALKLAKSQIPPHLIEKEIAALKYLAHHPFVLQLRSSFKQDRNFWIETEVILGGSLATLACTYFSLEEPVIAFYTAQITEGLLYIHENGWLHGDLKADNVLITTNGNIKIIDFGLANQIAPGEKLPSPRHKGFFGHIPLEAHCLPDNLPVEFDYKHIDHSYDWYSLGALIYWILENEAPKTSAAIQTTYFQQRLYEKPLEIEGVSSEIKDLIACLLRINPQHRYNGEDVLFHSYFKTLFPNARNIAQIRQMILSETCFKPPFIPDLKHFENILNQ